jgi:hypothetical protein
MSAIETKFVDEVTEVFENAQKETLKLFVDARETIRDDLGECVEPSCRDRLCERSVWNRYDQERHSRICSRHDEGGKRCGLCDTAMQTV